MDRSAFKDLIGLITHHAIDLVEQKHQLGIRQRDAGEEGLGLSRIGKEKCFANVMQVLRISSEDTPNLAIC